MRTFQKFYDALVEYLEQYGNLKVPQKYETTSGYGLGRAVDAVRTGHYKVTEEQRKQLDEIGFVWQACNKNLNFNDLYQLLVNYVQQYGNCDVPSKYVTDNNIRLGTIVQNMRNRGRNLSEQELNMLSEIGFQWKVKKHYSFDLIYSLMLDYKKQHGNLNVPVSYMTDTQVRLGKIMHNIKYGNRKVSEEEKKKLDDIGFKWRIHI